MFKKHRSRCWNWIAWAAFLSIIGTVFHFLNDWTGNSRWTVWFAPVNESIWEHLKLLYFPGWIPLIVGVIREKQNFAAQTAGIILGMIWITAAYYTLYGITGRNWGWVNILIFIIGCCIAAWIGQHKPQCLANAAADGIAAFLLFVFLILFLRFTYAPPDLPFFADPQSGQSVLRFI